MTVGNVADAVRVVLKLQGIFTEHSTLPLSDQMLGLSLQRTYSWTLDSLQRMWKLLFREDDKPELLRDTFSDHLIDILDILAALCSANAHFKRKVFSSTRPTILLVGCVADLLRSHCLENDVPLQMRLCQSLTRIMLMRSSVLEISNAVEDILVPVLQSLLDGERRFAPALQVDPLVLPAKCVPC